MVNQADDVVPRRDSSSQIGWKKLGWVSELNVLVLGLFSKVFKDPIFPVMKTQPG